MTRRPLIGITIDNVDNDDASGRYESKTAYCHEVLRAGGLPVLLAQEVALVADYVQRCDGFLLTGGNDIRSEAFGVPRHPMSECMAASRQEFDLALLEGLTQIPDRPVLAVCLGMQLMALHAGGRMHQHLPDILPNAVEVHQNDHRHPIVVVEPDSMLMASPRSGVTISIDESVGETVVSSHHQAVTDAGRLRVVASSLDGTIEAIDDPNRRYYVGVQWHPERGDGLFGYDFIQRFVEACAGQ